MKRKRGVTTKAFVLVLALVLALGAAIGGTIAWLTDSTDKVTNTFTVGNIDIELTETKPADQTAKMVPGNEIEKDPKVTVKKDSEACWLFVKVEEENNTISDADYKYIDWAVREGWTKGDGTTIPANVYYRSVTENDAAEGVTYYVLTASDDYDNGHVKVNENVTKDDMDALTDTTYPTLSFTAYAVQQANVTRAEDAWAKLDQNNTNP